MHPFHMRHNLLELQADRMGSGNGHSTSAQQEVSNDQQQQQQHATKADDEPEVLPAESAIMDDPEVNADQGGTEFDAKAADVQTPVGAQG